MQSCLNTEDSMFVCLLLGIIYTFVVTDVGHCSKESDEYYYKMQKLYQESAEDNMSCWFHWHEDTKKACNANKLEKKKELLKVVLDAWHNKHYIKPVDDCKGGYAQFDIGLFGGPSLLPCSEDAFLEPKYSQKEIDDKYRELKKLFNEYDAICWQPLSKVNCDQLKWERGQALAKAIQKAEQDDYIPRNCQPDGIGAYTFNQGMDPTDMPCKPMPDGTKYGDPGTIRTKTTAKPDEKKTETKLQPKHSQKETYEVYYNLKALWNKYNAICFQAFSSVNCEKQKWERGQELAKAIQKAENEDYIDKNCKSDGIGSYSFDQGMELSDMPCKPMPEGTKYGDPGTITGKKT